MANSVTDKLILTWSTDGKSIKVVATATAGTTIHTWPTNTATYHEVYLYCHNTSTTAVKLTVEYWSWTAPDDNIIVTIPAQSWEMLVVPGLLLKGNATALVIRAFAGTASVLTINGYYHLIA